MPAKRISSRMKLNQVAYHGLLGFGEGMPTSGKADDGFREDDSSSRDGAEDGVDRDGLRESGGSYVTPAGSPHSSREGSLR